MKGPLNVAQFCNSAVRPIRHFSGYWYLLWHPTHYQKHLLAVPLTSQTHPHLVNAARNCSWCCNTLIRFFAWSMSILIAWTDSRFLPISQLKSIINCLGKVLPWLSRPTLLQLAMNRPGASINARDVCRLVTLASILDISIYRGPRIRILRYIDIIENTGPDLMHRMYTSSCLNPPPPPPCMFRYSTTGMYWLYTCIINIQQMKTMIINN